MSKFDAALDKYAAQLRTILPEDQVDSAFLRVVTKQLGPTIYHQDASLVSTSDPKELEHIKTKYLQGKLGLAGPELDGALETVSELMKGHRRKYRAVFYYLLLRELNFMPAPDEGKVYYDAYIYLGTPADTPPGDPAPSVFISLDRIASVYTQHVDYDESALPDGQRVQDIRDKGRYGYEYHEKWGDLVALDSPRYGAVYYQLTDNSLKQLNQDLSGYTGFEASQLTGGDADFFTGTIPDEAEARVTLHANFVTQTYSKYVDYEDGAMVEGKPADDIWETGTFERIPHDLWGNILQLTSLEGEISNFVIADDGHLQELNPDCTETAALVLERTEIMDSCSA